MEWDYRRNIESTKKNQAPSGCLVLLLIPIHQPLKTDMLIDA